MIVIIRVKKQEYNNNKRQQIGGIKKLILSKTILDRVFIKHN